jgi:DNA-binding transcriptional MerR regulator
MAQWYVKELSKLTHVSVQTLHHYDKIGLLKPSLRHDNGYRVYSESDLLRLRKIIALKSFCFELAQIKELLSENTEVIGHLVQQSCFLKGKTKYLQEANISLDSVIESLNDCDPSHPHLLWGVILDSVEVNLT